MQPSARTQNKLALRDKLGSVPLRYIMGLGIAYISTAVFAMIVFAFVLAQGSYSLLVTFLAENPAFFASRIGALSAAASVAVVGLLLFAIREKALFLYAALELGASVGFALDACERLGNSQNWTSLGAALLGATYVVVRGLDNLAKAWQKYRPKVAVHESPSPIVNE